MHFFFKHDTPGSIRFAVCVCFIVNVSRHHACVFQGAHAVFHLTKNVTKTFLYMDAVFDNQSELSEDMTAAETVM